MAQKQQLVSFLYGFSEGPWHSKHFAKELKKQGYQVTKHVAQADIVIAHSAGCFYTDEVTELQKLVLINPTYWPGRRNLPRGIIKIVHDFMLLVRPGYFLFSANKLLHNLWYGLVQPRRNKYMLGRVTKYNLEEELRLRSAVLVRNDYDPWLTPKIDHLAQINPKITIVHFEGDHDDCWRNPKKYISAILNT